MNDFYDNYISDIIKTFEYDIKKGNIDPEIYDLNDKKAKKNYDNILNVIKMVNPREFKTKDFEKCDKKIMYDVFKYLVDKVYGNYGLNVFDDFINTIHYQETNQFLNGVTSKIYNKNEHKFLGTITALPNANVTGVIATMFHEFTHFLFNSLGPVIDKKKYYGEILPIFSEKVASQHLEEIFNDKKINDKIESTRLECIKWHYVDNPKQVKDFIELYERSTTFYKCLLAEDNYWVTSKEDILLKKSYDENLAASYGIGYIYANMLYEMFKNDENDAKETLKKLYYKDMDLNDTLSRYNISLRNMDVCNKATSNIYKIKNLK